MMNSQSMQILSDPVFRSRMPLFDGTIAATGLSKTQTMSGFLDKHSLQYSGSYMAYDPRTKDRSGFISPWITPEMTLLDSRGPMGHLSGTEGKKRILYRQHSSSSEEGHPHSSSLCHPAVKQGFTIYTKSPGSSSPTAATSVAGRKQKTGGENPSPTSENSVYLAVPKPVYRHNPCCNELGCVRGKRYSVEPGSQRGPQSVYEHNWMQTDANYAERPPIQAKVQDKLLQQRGLQFEPHAEPVKRMALDTYSPSAARTLPAMIDPNYSGYPCTPKLIGSLSEQSHRLQTPPRGYSSLNPSHPTYEHMTSEVYQECSPMSIYGQLTQHPVFYYPQANEEVQNSTRCKSIGSKQRDDVPVIRKRTTSNPREHYLVPQSLHGEIPLTLPNTEMFPNHSFIQGFDYPCYAVPGYHLNARQAGAPLKRQNTPPSFLRSSTNASPSSQKVDHSWASAANLHKDKANMSLNIDQSQPSSPVLCVDQTSPARYMSQAGISPTSIQMNRFFPPLSSLHIDRHILPPAGLSMNRLVDRSPCDAQVTCPKQPKPLPVTPAAWLPGSPSHSSDGIHTAASNSANVRKIIHSPSVVTGNKYNSPVSSSGSTSLKGCLKRSLSHSSPPNKIKEEGRNFCEGELVKKRQKVKMENVKVGNKTDSPPMPVIDNVFSLAPYQAYLQASGVLFPGRVPHKTVQSLEQCADKTKLDIKQKMPDQEKQQSVVRSVPKEICPDAPSEKSIVEISEPKNIKVENIDAEDSDIIVVSPVSQTDYSEVTIKQEPLETASSDSEPMLVIKKCEPNELERKLSLTEENGTSGESKPAESTAQMNSSSQDDAHTLHEQVQTTLQSKPIITTQTSERKIHFKKIPPQCLKLSTYKIILPEMKHSIPSQAPEKPPAQPVTEFIPKRNLQVPVRKHFLELHHFLCKLVSKAVFATSEQDLRTWLSELELNKPASPSTKVLKVSCLLGVKAREVWLNEEIKSALHKVLERLREYTIQKRSPFPHVMRTGAVFLPMLVMKEILFPMVQGSFIDQVLQEHKVELRPTTLSEEKILIQLHKQACSSRLRRLMSLKHLPDIYADVVNLLHYACVCKHLESTSPDVQKRVQD
uniref:Uncharacterized protein n=1 Tax=Echeneis naucrates TaxID=173247 RepID=A0A665WB91_ECHNA